MSAYAIQFQRLPGIPLAVVRRQVSPAELSRLVPECCGLVWNALRAQGVRGGRHVAVYLGGGSVEIGAEIFVPFTETGELVRSATPAGLVASTTHLGRYGGLGAAHDAVHHWCAGNGRTLAGPKWEIYGHWLDEWTADPSKIRTDVYYLLSD